MRACTFQFQTGSIRRGVDTAILDSLHSFNSKLVRLEGVADEKPEYFCGEFQFQTGSIRSGLLGLLGINLVSIPNWFD